MIVITIILALLLLGLAFRGIDWHNLLNTLKQGQIKLLIVGFVVISASVYLRSLRWRELLSAEMKLPVTTIFWGTSIGYLGNSFLPARAGEIIRSTLIGYHTKMSKSYVLATALTERIIDAVFLLIVSIISLLFIAESFPDWIETVLLVLTIVAGGGLILLVLAHRFQNLVSHILASSPLPANLRMYLNALANQFIRGTTAFQDRGRGLRFLGLTFAIWLLDMLSAMIVARAFDMRLTGFQALFLLAALGLSSAVPSTPGYVGIYQFVSVTVLEPLGFARTMALAFIIAFQGISYMVFILWGTIGFFRLNYGQTDTHQTL